MGAGVYVQLALAAVQNQSSRLSAVFDPQSAADVPVQALGCKAMLDELGKFAGEPVTPAELSQAVSYLAGQAEVRRQSGSAIAGEILEAWLIGNGLGDLEDPAAEFRAVTAEDVLRVASQYLGLERKVEGVVRGTGVSSPVGG